MRSAPIVVLASLALFACNALVGFDSFVKQPDAGVGDDDDTNGDDDDTEAGGSSGAGGEGGGSPASSCKDTSVFGAAVKLDGPVNSASFEVSPSLTDDELSVVFQRGSSDAQTFALMLATRLSTKEAFGEPAALSLTLSDRSVHPALTRDGLTLYWSELGQTGGSSDIFFATRNTAMGQFADPKETRIASNIDESSPSVTGDGEELFFVANEALNSNTTKHIYKSARDLGEFSARTKVDELVGPDGIEQGIALSKDGLTIFFGSTRAGGPGNLDVWTAHRTTRTEKFGAPVVVPQVSSAGGDWPSWISADGCRLYLSSDRSGSGELYVATRSK